MTMGERGWEAEKRTGHMTLNTSLTEQEGGLSARIGGGEKTEKSRDCWHERYATQRENLLP